MEQLDTAARVLLGAVAAGGGNSSSTYVPGGYVPGMGSQQEHRIAMGCSWSAFALSVVILAFYAWHSMRASCGWEEVYVCAVELIKTILEIFCEPLTPATITQASGRHTTWLRYSEWLLTCPVILIHLSNLTGLQDNYSKRTMLLLVTDIGTIVMGITAAFSSGPAKIVFFCLGCIYASGTFVNAGKVYFESYHAVPAGQCRTLVKAMAWTFFISWAMFPLLFLMGPEGFGHLTPYGSIIGHTFADLLSKNLWGLLGHHLRNKVREHIVVHGDVRKPTHLRLAGKQMQVDTFVDDDAAAGAVRHPASAYLARRSFVNIRDSLQAQGVAVRASLDGSAAPAAPRSRAPQPGLWVMQDDGHAGGTGGGLTGATAFVSLAAGRGSSKAASPAPMLGRASSLQPVAAAAAGGGGGGSGRSSPAPVAAAGSGAGAAAGLRESDAIRVVLAAPDDVAAEQLRAQLALLPLTVDVVTAVGPEQLLALAAWAAANGGADCCLLHAGCLAAPEAGDAAATMTAQLRALGHSVCIWGEAGQAGGLFAAGEVDGWADTPTQLTALLQRMRGLRRTGAAVARGGAAASSLLLQSSEAAGSPASPQYASPTAAAAGEAATRMPAALAPITGAAGVLLRPAAASPSWAAGRTMLGALMAGGGDGTLAANAELDAALLLQLLDEVSQLRRQLAARGE